MTDKANQEPVALKPCPFCGGSVQREPGPSLEPGVACNETSSIRCPKGCCYTTIEKNAKIVDRWNTRPTPPGDVAELVERLREYARDNADGAGVPMPLCNQAASEIEALTALSRAPAVTDAMVERAALAMAQYRFGEERCKDVDHELVQGSLLLARETLEAALSQPAGDRQTDLCSTDDRQASKPVAGEVVELNWFRIGADELRADAGNLRYNISLGLDGKWVVKIGAKAFWCLRCDREASARAAAENHYKTQALTATPSRDDVIEDAERWRALLEGGRVRMLGAANVGIQAEIDPDDWVHFGAEFWSQHPSLDDPKYSEELKEQRNWFAQAITALVDRLRALKSGEGETP